MTRAAAPAAARPDLAPAVEAVREAAAARRHLAARGAGSWWPELPRGTSPLSGAPASISGFEPADLVVTCGAATPLATLAGALAARGTFVALDPPGSPSRTIGSVLATAAAGPLAAGCGAPRDQVLGVTFVAGNGTVVKSGGRVVKNVAGFDLAKLVVGGYGGFGYIADVHLRLRARPPHDATRAWRGTLHEVAGAAAALLRAGATPAALEVVSPRLAAQLGLADAWTLLLRALGTPVAVAEELDAAARVAGPAAGAGADVGSGAWAAWGPAVGRAAVLLRIGADPAAWTDAVALAEEHLGTPELVSVTAPRGTVRVGARDVTPRAVARLREAAARRGWPVTLERGPAALRTAAGVWGALPDATLRLAQRLRQAFDPDGVFAVPLWADGGRAAGR